MTAGTAGITPAVPSVEPVLDVDGVTLQYKTKEHLITATYRVSFKTYPADRFVILGPSGCGKSTLLKGIAGYLHPVEGRDAPQRRTSSGIPGPDRCMVFQEFDQLLPWKTVMGNITFALMNGGKCKTQNEAKELASEYIHKVKLDRFEDTYPHMLSGGMKQRVAIARAMAMEPAVLLMDEPFAALDALTRRQMQEELLQLWDDTRFTVIFVTHSIEEAVIVGSRILIMSPHPGQVKAEVNAHQHSHADVGSDDFSTLQTRIHELIFADRVLEEETQPQHV